MTRTTAEFTAAVQPMEGSAEETFDSITQLPRARIVRLAERPYMFRGEIIARGYYNGAARTEGEARREVWRALRHAVSPQIDYWVNIDVELTDVEITEE